MAPLLLVVIAIAGIAFGPEAAETRIAHQICGLAGDDGATLIQRMLQSARAPVQGLIATMIALLTLFLGASLVLSELKSSLNLIWRVPTLESKGLLYDIVGMLKRRLVSFAMVLGIGFLLLVSLVVNAVLAGLGERVERYLILPEFALPGLTLVIWFAVTAVLFAFLYKFLPDVKITWADVAVGSIVTSALFTIGRMFIALYLGKSGVTSAYGAAGSLVVVLLWIYYSAQIFFLGAEFTQVYSDKYGSRLRSRLSGQPPDLSMCPDESRIVIAS
jgi:membrane protein